MADDSYKVPVIFGPHKDNIFYVAGATLKALTEAGERNLGEELVRRIWSECNSFDEALALCSEYVDFIDDEEPDDNSDK